MQEIDDERWRLAARTLQLDLVGDDGKVVPNERGTQSAAMRGRVDALRVHVRYGVNDPRDRITVVNVTLRRRLFLGLETQVYRNPAPPSNRYGVVPQAVHSATRSIDEGRGRTLFDDTGPGRALWKRLHELGSLGWVELTDSHLRVQAEVFVNSAEGWVQLVRRAVQTALLADAARDELPTLPWETRLLDALDVERARLGLELDRPTFHLRGSVRSVPASVRLAAEEGRYALVFGASFAPPLPKGERLARRPPPSLLARLWSMGRSKASRSWEHVIDASALVRERLSATQLADIAALSEKGHVLLEGGNLTFRCVDLEIAQAPILDDLVAVAASLGKKPGTPYREG
jgi:hypothetical protein